MTLELAWTKSSYCGNSACVEVATLDNRVLMRDSKTDDGVFLEFASHEWAEFVAGVRNGEFDPR